MNPHGHDVSLMHSRSFSAVDSAPSYLGSLSRAMIVKGRGFRGAAETIRNPRLAPEKILLLRMAYARRISNLGLLP
jgi:hypothetical protein